MAPEPHPQQTEENRFRIRNKLPGTAPTCPDQIED